MTKLRAPLTFENCLARVAGHIGWAKVAEIVGQAERTVRNWSEPDTTAAIPLEAALKLDVAYHAAGGEGTPFLICYATRFDTESLAACPGREELLDAAARTALETGEAVSAALAAARPRAGRADFAIAEKELEESIAAAHHTLAALRARRKAVEDGGLIDEEEAMVAAGQGGAPAMTA